MRHALAAALATALAATMLTVAGCDSGQAPSPVAGYRADPAAVKRGKLVFAGTCGAYCHKLQPGQGGIPYLFDCAWKHGGSDQEIFQVIRDGVPDTPMAAFGGALPDGDNDIWKVIAYLRATAACGQ